jgi:hypothetical protein
MLCYVCCRYTFIAFWNQYWDINCYSFDSYHLHIIITSARIWESVVNFWKQKQIRQQKGLWNTGLVCFYGATEGWLVKADISWVPPAGSNEQTAVVIHALYCITQQYRVPPAGRNERTAVTLHTHYTVSKTVQGATCRTQWTDSSNTSHTLYSITQQYRVPLAGRNEQTAVTLHTHLTVSHNSAGCHLQDAMNRQQ